MTEQRMCSSPGCRDVCSFQSKAIWKRDVRYRSQYCIKHAEQFWANYKSKVLKVEGHPDRDKNASKFDLEHLLIDEQQTAASRLTLREVGGIRRLDCDMGIFEALAIDRELEKQSFPRPSTHRGFADTICALGATLRCVRIDNVLDFTERRVFEAKLSMRRVVSCVEVDVRISDAVVLSLICSVPIYVADRVLDVLNPE